MFKFVVLFVALFALASAVPKPLSLVSSSPYYGSAVAYSGYPGYGYAQASPYNLGYSGYSGAYPYGYSGLYNNGVYGYSGLYNGGVNAYSGLYNNGLYRSPLAYY
ncbi:uncharacterized protein [Diabrotica undecimpunctata]|uniref:uncharacterized protein n=1 Tax=Diabrotica undecimpunctata TaxID=50387 RepID=UPI003B6319F4